VCEYNIKGKVDNFRNTMNEIGCGVTNDTLESALLTPIEFARFNRPDEEKTNIELAEEIILIIQRSSERFGSKRRRTMMYDEPNTAEP
jgi:hypothetical protein